MPFTRPTLTQLRTQVAQDIAAALPGTDALLRQANLTITGIVQAGLSNQHYGYLDWIAKQAVPFTATDEFLQGWGALKNIYLKASASAVLSIAFPGTLGKIIPSGVSVLRGDGIEYTTVGSAAVDGTGFCVVNAVAIADPTGQSGAFGNATVGTAMTLGQSISGISSSGVVSGTVVIGVDLETQDSFRGRVLDAYQRPPQGGAPSDYEQWAKEVAGVTRAWCAPIGFGAGSVVLYVMLDIVRAAQNGFPQGTNGVATSEPRAAAATGDQLLVANYIFPLRPATALLYVVAPTSNPINFTIKGIPVGSQGLVGPAISGVFLSDGKPGGSIPLAHIWSAIASISGVDDFVITSPVADPTNPAGALPVVGTITFI
jgi:uncharacterized phage protein gp47/JayE